MPRRKERSGIRHLEELRELIFRAASEVKRARTEARNARALAIEAKRALAAERASKVGSTRVPQRLASLEKQVGQLRRTAYFKVGRNHEDVVSRALEGFNSEDEGAAIFEVTESLMDITKVVGVAPEVAKQQEKKEEEVAMRA